MSDTTTIKVSIRTRDALRDLANREGRTLDSQLEQLIRRERRRTMGCELSEGGLSDEDRKLLDASASDVADASR